MLILVERWVNSNHDKLYAKFFEVKSLLSRGNTIIAKQEAINKAKKNYGYCALTCNFASGELYESAKANLSLAAEQLNSVQIEDATDEVNNLLGNR